MLRCVSVSRQQILGKYKGLTLGVKGYAHILSATVFIQQWKSETSFKPLLWNISLDLSLKQTQLISSKAGDTACVYPCQISKQSAMTN